jgi:6-phosphogluconolactonase
VWFCVSGEDKAAALTMALLGTGQVQLPAAGVAGTERTLWLVDKAAASQLPADLIPPGLL